MNPNGKATLHRRGGGTLMERWVAGGSLANMIKRFMLEVPGNRRDFLIMHDDMEYQSAEIQNLADQYIFTEGTEVPNAVFRGRSLRPQGRLRG
jgi:hypothetical protein